jgi:hypothetical protein
VVPEGPWTATTRAPGIGVPLSEVTVALIDAVVTPWAANAVVPTTKTITISGQTDNTLFIRNLLERNSPRWVQAPSLKKLVFGPDRVKDGRRASG